MRTVLPLVLLIASMVSAHTAQAALVGFWSGDGTAADSTGNNNGTLMAGATFGPSQTPGNQAFSFDGTSFVEAGSTGLPTGNQDRTMDLWFNVTSAGATNNEAFLAGYGLDGTYTHAYELFVDYGVTSYGVAFGQWGTELLGPQIAFGTWHNLAVTNTGDLASLYLDGNLVATQNMSIDTTSGSTFYIGHLANASLYPVWDDKRKLDGFVDDVAVFDTALSQSDIQQLMASELTPTPEPSTLALVGTSLIGLLAGQSLRRRFAALTIRRLALVTYVAVAAGSISFVAIAGPMTS
jgi:hypothetical protein